jgi:hypothetical protein
VAVFPLHILPAVSRGCDDPVTGAQRHLLLSTGGGENGGKAARRREGEQRRTPRRVTEAASLRIGGMGLPRS